MMILFALYDKSSFAKVYIFHETHKFYNDFFNNHSIFSKRSHFLHFCFLLLPIKIVSLQAVTRRLLHRYSIVTPSLVHRFDGLTME